MKKISDLHYKRIAHKKQRYPTVGDYWRAHGVWEFRVSAMRDPRHEALVLLHELVEFIYTQSDGISVESIDKFDIQFEKDRAAGFHRPDDEPGWDPNAPYRRHHIFAEKIERMMAEKLGVDWDEYAEAVNEL